MRQAIVTATIVLAVTVVASASTGVAGRASDGFDALRVAKYEAATTCLYAPSGKRIGCVPDAYSCGNIYVSRAGERWLLTEDHAEKDLDFGSPEVAAERVRIEGVLANHALAESSASWEGGCNEYPQDPLESHELAWSASRYGTWASWSASRDVDPGAGGADYFC